MVVSGQRISASLICEKADVMSGFVDKRKRDSVNEGDRLPDCLRPCRGGREISSLRVDEMRLSSRRWWPLL